MDYKVITTDLSLTDATAMVLAMYSVGTADVAVSHGFTRMSGEAYLGKYSIWAFQACEADESEVLS